jgi:hypothetical protein
MNMKISPEDTSRDYLRRKGIIGVGALAAILLGLFGKAPGATDFFSFCLGVLAARMAFKV